MTPWMFRIEISCMIYKYWPKFLYLYLVICFLLVLNVFFYVFVVCNFACGIWCQDSFGCRQRRNLRVCAELVVLMGLNWLPEVSKKVTVYFHRNISIAGDSVFHRLVSYGVFWAPHTKVLWLYQLVHWYPHIDFVPVEALKQKLFTKLVPGRGRWIGEGHYHQKCFDWIIGKQCFFMKQTSCCQSKYRHDIPIR